LRYTTELISNTTRNEARKFWWSVTKPTIRTRTR
jgi:hypothetical protein